MNLQDVRRDTWSGSPEMERWVHLTHMPTGIMVKCLRRHKDEEEAWRKLEELVK